MSVLDEIARKDCIDAGVEQVFDALLKKGNTVQFAAMVALKKAPGTKGSEMAFWDGRDGKRANHGFGDMPREMAEMFIAKAKRAGVQVHGKWYMGGLADHRGVCDPGAWVSDTGDVLHTARTRNLNVKGIVNYQGELAPPPPDVPLAPKIVNETLQEMAQEDPGLLQRRSVQDVKEEIIDKHGAPARFRKKRDRRPGKSFVNFDAEL